MKSVERSNVLSEGWLALSFGLLVTVMTIGTLRDVGQVVGSGQVYQSGLGQLLESVRDVAIRKTKIFPESIPWAVWESPGNPSTT